MIEDEPRAQQSLHEAIEAVLVEDEVLRPGRVLVGWVVLYETAALDPSEQASAGHFYGPAEMTTWRALGLVEWVRRFGLGPDDEGDDDEG